MIGSGLAKRGLDLALCAALAPVALPLGLGTAVAVRRQMGPPVLFRQPRIGHHGRVFDVLKFRTMTDDRDAQGNLLPDAERLPAFGRFLRRTSLDEIPQLLNVARGDMSFVGPRPLLVRYREHYSAEEFQRHTVRPGITGLAQVSGRNGLGWNERLALDAHYARTRTLLGDLAILIRTALQAVRSEGVSVVAGDSGDPLDVERGHPSEGDLQLRRLYRRDLPLRVEWMRSPSVSRHMNLPADVTLESTNTWYEGIQNDPLRREFAVERTDGTVVAMTGLRATEAGGDAEFYTFVRPGCHGQGLGSRATDLTLRWADTHTVFDGTTLTVARANTRALAIYRSRGFAVTHETEDRLWMRRARPGREPQ